MIIQRGHTPTRYIVPSQQGNGVGRQTIHRDPTVLVWRNEYPTRYELEQLKIYRVIFNSIQSIL